MATFALTEPPLNDKNIKEDVICDAQFVHPFTSMIIGPSGSGKTTFLKNLLDRSKDLISAKFDHIHFFLGTSLDQNLVLKEMKSHEEDYPFKMNFMDVRECYGSDLNQTTFAEDIIDLCKKSHQQNEKMCLVFDDLMSDLSGSSLISDLFSKLSAHYDTSVFFISQNLFHRGKKQGDSITIYRNTKYLVLFDSVLDHHTFTVIASRIGVESKFLCEIARIYRYVIIRGGQDVRENMRFVSNIFNYIKVGSNDVPVQSCFVPLRKKR